MTAEELNELAEATLSDDGLNPVLYRADAAAKLARAVLDTLNRDGGLPSLCVQLRARVERLEAAHAEIINTLRAHLECDGNSYANRELYRELLALAEARP